MKHRREKREAASTGPSGPKVKGRDSRGIYPDSRSQQDRGVHRQGRVIDPELSTALGSLVTELQGTSQSIQKLTRARPSHRNCEVHEGLVANSDRIQRQLSNLQSSVNNIRNLHPNIEGPSRPPEPAKEERRREMPRGMPREMPRAMPREMPRERRRESERVKRGDDDYGYYRRQREPVGYERSRHRGRESRSYREW